MFVIEENSASLDAGSVFAGMFVTSRRMLLKVVSERDAVRTYGQGWMVTRLTRFLEIAFVLQWNIGQPKGGCCVLIVSAFV